MRDFGGEPSPLETGLAIFYVNKRTESVCMIVARSNVKAGDEFQIINGTFKGLAGIIQEPPDIKTRARALMQTMIRQVYLLVPAGNITGGWAVLPAATL